MPPLICIGASQANVRIPGRGCNLKYSYLRMWGMKYIHQVFPVNSLISFGD